MTDKQKKRIEELGLNVRDFEPKTETPSTEDLLEAINILTDIVLGGEEDD